MLLNVLYVNFYLKSNVFYLNAGQVVDAADVILEVLDARDPLGSRCAQMEETIISSGTNKKLVLVLNKIGEYMFIKLEM